MIKFQNLISFGFLLAFASLYSVFMGRAVLCESNTPETLLDAARARPEVPGAPEKSDITMRSLEPRRHHLDTLEAMKGFHATWLEWSYSDSGVNSNRCPDFPDFISQVKETGAVFGGAYHAGSYCGEEPPEIWNAKDIEGNMAVRATDTHFWGCANNPEFRAGNLRYAKSVIDDGAYLLQRDEPAQNKHAFEHGACFCDYCVEGFNAWLKENADPEALERAGAYDMAEFNYRDHLLERDAPVGSAFSEWDGDQLKDYFRRFQNDATVEFHRWLRGELNAHAGRYVPISVNNNVLYMRDLDLVFDYWLGELSQGRATPEFLYDFMKESISLGKTLSTTMPLYRLGSEEHDNPEWIQHIRQTMATLYAMGGHMEMPWDTYLPGKPRFFGQPEDYADLSAFVRAMAPYLNGYTDAAALGCNIEDDRWTPEAPPVRIVGGSQRTYAFTRAIPDQAGAPVVIHLIDWRPRPRPFRLDLRPDVFFGDLPLTVRLFTPVAYEKEAHSEAYETGDYSRMVGEIQVAGGYMTNVEIPALHPWGILVVEAQEQAGEGGVWQPAMRIEEAGCGEKCRLIIETFTSDADLRYTLDGSEPGHDSRLYSQPLELEKTVTVKARAFRGENASEISRYEIIRASTLAPDAPDFSEDLQLWLSAMEIGEDIEDGAPVFRWGAKKGPSAEVPDVELGDGRNPEPPIFSRSALNGRPAVRFAIEEAQLAITGFSNEVLANNDFTLFFVSKSDDPAFGLSGNRKCGRGGVPRLYMTRQHFFYDILGHGLTVGSPESEPCITTFSHDGIDTARTYLNGIETGRRSNAGVVETFGGWGEGGGGHLAIPYWEADQPRKGDVSEIIVYSRQLSHEEIERVSRYLGTRYGIIKGWVLK